MSTAFIFPGQGAQHVGMGKDLCDAHAEARAVFQAAEQATGLPLAKLCFEGPEDELARTDVCQPAILTVSAAFLAVLDARFPKLTREPRPAFMAGLSLGEYTALHAAGAMDLPTAARLVACRGKLMQQAATAIPSGMVSVMGLDEEAAVRLCQAAAGAQVLTCANFNCPGQVVLSGELEACKRAEAMAKDFGATAAVALKVAGAFHSQIMQPAADELAKALATTGFRDPMTTVIANVDARAYEAPGEIAPKLLAQLVSPVRWQQCVAAMLAAGVTTFYEIGPGRVLAGLIRRIDRKAQVVSVNSLESVEKVVSSSL